LTSQVEIAEKLIRSREGLVLAGARPPLRKNEAEGGCGVIGIACSEKIAGRHLLQSLQQMRNRGNSKGGGIAAAGLSPEELGVSRDILENDYLLSVAYLDPRARAEVERTSIAPTFDIDSVFSVPQLDNAQPLKTLAVRPPEVALYFVRVKADRVDEFQKKHNLNISADSCLSVSRVEDEIVYQNSFRLNRAFYASEGEKRAFVLSHGKNLLVLKMVGYGDDVVRHYRLEDFHAHVWIGHHRYPTKGKVWHPGGAHPFAGLHEALVHNGDFANYASICEHLAQRNIYPLFLTDTEVSVLLFDLLHRTYGYPLEYVFEALAPTTERDFTLLPEEKQRIYRHLQTTHIHSSPDGPWFFLLAQSDPVERACRLIGITDTSMLRPQVFALQQGDVSIGLAASEKQAIDAALESLSREDARVWPRADLYWNARGGSHTDGGAFIFSIQGNGDRSGGFSCTDKFGRPISASRAKAPFHNKDASTSVTASLPDLPGQELFTWVKERICAWTPEAFLQFLRGLERSASSDEDRKRAFEILTLLMDRRYPTGRIRRSSLLSALDRSLANMVESIRCFPSHAFAVLSVDDELSGTAPDCETLVVDADGFAPEGDRSLARAIVHLYQQGHRRFTIIRTRGQRFIANGLGPDTLGVRIDVYGSPGDYLASGIDGAAVVVHGSAQDQVAQIMKGGKLCIYGDVGQTFLYAAKGGDVFVLGNAAGRPLINAVGKPRVVINGTCLDYLAESCMAGDPLEGGGFVVVNGVAFDDDGQLIEMDTPYPGGNLFSLSSGGAIYLRDPHGRVSEDQLNGGEFEPMRAADWTLIRPYLEENERLFGIRLQQLLDVDSRTLSAEQVYRKVRPQAIQALQAEEAWVKMHNESAPVG
jgi:glutamate synthase domain-containing protein 1/glutamate synthase domain-containing protein 3